MGQVKREKWRCRSCRSADSSSTQGSVSEEPQGVCASEELLSAVNTKLDLLVSLKANVDTLLTLPAKVDELLTLKPAVQCLQETVKTLQQSIDDLSLKYDSVLAKATENEKNTEALQVRLAEVCSVVDEQSRTIQRLQGDLNYLEQRSRSTNLEIHGLPCDKGENLERIIADLGDKLDLPPLQAGDVLAIHRLAAKPGPAPPVLLRRRESLPLKTEFSALVPTRANASWPSITTFRLLGTVAAAPLQCVASEEWERSGVLGGSLVVFGNATFRCCRT
ncbi:hypothetical protein HPB47_016354 [Ixodes persulcatus]|uniref:Uncharacterized protein n=1 Tax=Ixodes persulcatus TaxID=34615 RepID=A0AC60QR53_IXOPE|nr:hypothetical protein HPB47_016354 [Ixodes persulcatus]